MSNLNGQSPEQPPNVWNAVMVVTTVVCLTILCALCIIR